MKLLFLGKRRPMGRDLIARPYGRFYHLPRLLAEAGHEVHSLLMDYRHGAAVDMHDSGVHWISRSLWPGKGGSFGTQLLKLVRDVRPDWIIGCSDTYFGILAWYYGQKYGVRSCIDAYDNYESYIPWMLPLHAVWRKALQRADLVTAAGPGLLRLMSVDRGERPGAIVPMAADMEGFEPLDQAACRQRLELPQSGRLIGYCGHIDQSRGLDVLFEAFEMLRKSHPEAELVLSGRLSRNTRIPVHARMLGYVADDKMPLLLNSMDVLVVVNRASRFGNHSHPVKLYEAMRCGIPVIATRTTATEWILANNQECLVNPGDAHDLCRQLAASLDRGAPVYGAITDWQGSAHSLEQALLEASTRGG
jgi:glycosyltransferase involved in cell wall biosynthesis